jgi:hypothetical protein
MSRLFMILTYVCGGAGLGLAIYFVQSPGRHEDDAMLVLTVALCVIVGGLSWVRHFLLWKSDARALGVQEQTPFFHWEVGFANGAFALAGLLAVVLGWGVQAMAAVVLAYTFYLLQAAIMHGWRYFSGQSRTPARLWGSFVGLSLMCVMVIAVSAVALADAPASLL